MAVVVVVPLPWREPVAVAAPFAEEPWTLLLLSGGGGEQARWSYLMRQPARTLEFLSHDGIDPFDELAALLGPPAATATNAPPFQGGVAGLAGYELGARVNPVMPSARPDWPDLACGVYPAVLAFDHSARSILAVGRGRDSAEARSRAEAAAAWIGTSRAVASPPHTDALVMDLRADDPAMYEAAVADVVARILAGEIFQANIARRWRGRLRQGATPWDLFARLSRDSPAPFAAYFRLSDRALVSNSPERFLEVRDGSVEARPIKGTRPRGDTPAADAALAAELTASAKDRAENLMIVDLMRNDLARVCRPGSVIVPECARLESYANVHHLVSAVTGHLAHGCTAADLLRAAFPPGSVTGAPKIQAMRVIAGHEPPRGPYCGSLFWAGVDGSFDSSVLIRTATLTRDADDWRVEARAGAGIVADSDPVAERLETDVKIAALQLALLGNTS